MDPKIEYFLTRGLSVRLCTCSPRWERFFWAVGEETGRIMPFMPEIHGASWLLPGTETPLNSFRLTYTSDCPHNALSDLIHDPVRPFRQQHFFLQQSQVLPLEFSQLLAGGRWLCFFVDDAEDVVLEDVGSEGRLAFWQSYGLVDLVGFLPGLFLLRRKAGSGLGLQSGHDQSLGFGQHLSQIFIYTYVYTYLMLLT